MILKSIDRPAGFGRGKGAGSVRLGIIEVHWRLNEINMQQLYREFEALEVTTARPSLATGTAPLSARRPLAR